MTSMTQLPFPKYVKGKLKRINYKLHDDCIIEQWIVPKGVEIVLITSTDFGTVILPAGTQDKRNFTIPRRIFRW
jgi:hypothetical protein